MAIEDASEAVPLKAKGEMDSESLLEETLVNNPGLLLRGLKLVGRQMPTAGGPLDLLGVDEFGKLVVFELKRGILSRDAVAQIIDYASDLEAMDPDVLAKHISDKSGEQGIEKIEEFREWYSRNYPEPEEGWSPIRMFLVGLGTDDTTERMVKFLANSSMDISLLTFYGFEYEGKTTPCQAGASGGRRRLSDSDISTIPKRRGEESAAQRPLGNTWRIRTLPGRESDVQEDLAGLLGEASPQLRGRLPPERSTDLEHTAGVYTPASILSRGA